MHAISFSIELLPPFTRPTAPTHARWHNLSPHSAADGQLGNLYILEQKDEQTEISFSTEKFSLPASEGVVERQLGCLVWGRALAIFRALLAHTLPEGDESQITKNLLLIVFFVVVVLHSYEIPQLLQIVRFKTKYIIFPEHTSGLPRFH